MQQLRVEPLTAESFAPYGKVLGRPATDPTATREDLDLWVGISDLLGIDHTKATWAYLKLRRHNLPVDRLERHCRQAEAFIPLEGSSVIVVAPPTDVSDPASSPDESAVRAFRIDGGAGIFFPKGAWHWAPFAITDEASFLLLFQQDILDDIDERKVGPFTITLY